MSRFEDHGGAGRGLPERWDPKRFNCERRDRQQEIERDVFGERGRSGSSPPPRSRDDSYYPHAEHFEKRDRFMEKEWHGPPARIQRWYGEEDEIDSFESSPSRGSGPMGPPGSRTAYDPRRAPPRPGIIRRQSSLDTFDRKPLPRHQEPPEVITMPGPGRSRRSPRYERNFGEIRIAVPDYHVDEGFRGYKESKVSTVRRKWVPEPEPEPEFEERESFEEVEEEPRYPRKGKTKIPERLVNKRAIIELGYPFEEEVSENLRAWQPTSIDNFRGKWLSSSRL